jgi:hypothetical protein
MLIMYLVEAKHHLESRRIHSVTQRPVSGGTLAAEGVHLEAQVSQTLLTFDDELSSFGARCQ